MVVGAAKRGAGATGAPNWVTVGAKLFVGVAKRGIGATGVPKLETGGAKLVTVWSKVGLEAGNWGAATAEPTTARMRKTCMM